MSEEYLLLKWGTLKGWNLGQNKAAFEAARKYDAAGEHSGSAMLQRDTDAQKEALCELIDAINGPITNDWSGERLTKEQAKAYVREYRS